MDAPAHVGCLIEVRLVGVISAEQIQDGNKERNDRGKKFRITGTGGPKKAIKFLKDGVKRQKDAKKK